MATNNYHMAVFYAKQGDRAMMNLYVFTAKTEGKPLTPTQLARCERLLKENSADVDAK